MSGTYNEKLKAFIQTGINDGVVSGKHDPFWQSLRSTGTELWLDTGDMEEAEANWTAEMTALTTNNTLINKEIQKGIYDDFVPRAVEIVSHLPLKEQVKEIAFILNARHGLRLAKKFGGMVSVELHTDTAYDIEAIVSYGLRYRELCPDQFIVKVPYTPEGLIGARRLREKGVRINFTLEFSARQNALVTLVAKPDYLNVFLGRIGAFIADNKIGDGSGAGENAVLSSQMWVTRLSAENNWKTRQIAASLRNYNQLDLLAGTDVYTMPPKVAAAGRKSLAGLFDSRLGKQYDVPLNDSAAGLAIEKFWEVPRSVIDLGRQFNREIPVTGKRIVEMAHEAGLGDMFPVMSSSDNERIAAEGKIPVLSSWRERIISGEMAPDTLLTLAGLASFTADQRQLDDRIRGIIGLKV
ncbi:MAG: transaldolase family protein [Bacteroidales bacterium]|jgi:transaldolase|nr:transaldolase family protein [Bacteroidales bacterium]